jgi:heme/copper-type cytochrome/quinol oxidase subunit 3
MSRGVTRSMEATDAVAAARVARQRRARSSGWWGVLLLIATEVALFSSLIATYFYLRFKTTVWPPPGVEKPSVTLPLVLTGVLIVAVLPMLAAVRTSLAARAGTTWALVALATVVQGGYLGVQIHLFLDDLHKFKPADNAYGSIYFTLLGVHHAHVAVGLALDAWLLLKLAGGLTNYRMLALRVVTLYWAFVALTAVPVVLTQLYPSL